MFGWQIRAQITPTWAMMFVGFVFTSAYYVAASLVFPESADEDHDAHFAANSRLVLGGVLVCNAVLFGWIVYLVGFEKLFSLRQIVISWSLFPVCLAAIVARDRRVVLGSIVWLIALYPLSLFWT